MPKKIVKKTDENDSDNFMDEFIETPKLFAEKKKNLKDDKCDEEINDKDLKKTDVNNLELQNLIKKRGRPRKIISPRQIVKAAKQPKLTTQELDSIHESNSIILRLPKYSDENLSDDKSIIKDNENNTDNYAYNDNDDTKISASDTNNKNALRMHLSDEELSDNDELLKIELKKKNAEIKRLKNELNTKSENFTEMNVNGKQNQKHIALPINTVNIDTNKSTPIKSEFACWHCTYNFDNPPCFIPEKYQSGTYYVFGNFCRDECSLSYILKDDEHKISLRRALLNKMHMEKYGTQHILRPAHPKELLEKFGGPKTIHQYRDDTVDYKEYKLKLSVIQCYLEEFCRN
jgi:hypothetical protein